jgi:hypothetical protein
MTVSRIAAVAAVVFTTAVVPAMAQQSGTGTGMPQSGSATQAGPLSDAMVHRVGKAIRSVTMIREQYTQRAQASNSPQARQTIDRDAQRDMAKAVTDQGLTLQQYDQVIQMAQADPTLQQRLLSVARSND